MKRFRCWESSLQPKRRITDRIIAIAYVVAFIFVTLSKMTYSWLALENSHYPFAAEEMPRFSVPEKINRRDSVERGRHQTVIHD